MRSAQDLLEDGLQRRRRSDELLLIAEETSAVHLRWAGNRLTTNGVTRARLLTAVALSAGPDGVRAGVVSRGGDVDNVLPDLVREAEHAAATGPPTAGAGPLPAPAVTAAWASPAAETAVSTLDAVLDGLGGAFGRAASTGRGLDGYAEDRVVTTFVAASTGARLRHAQPTGLLDLSMRADDGASVWAGRTATSLGAVSVGDLAEDLAARFPRRRAAGPLPAGRYEVLLSPACAADLMTHVYLAAGARAALDGQTAFGRPSGGLRLGDRLTDAPLTLRSDPHDPLLPCAPFLISRAGDDLTAVTDNGLPLAATRWIDDGVLAGLVQTRHTAAQTGQPPTALVDNLILEGPAGGPSLADMVRGTRRGLLITSLWYLRDVDPRELLLTGVTRDGVFVVEDGEIVAPAPDFRFNESPLSLLARVSEAGHSEPALPREWGDYFTRLIMPPLRIPDFSVGPPV